MTVRSNPPVRRAAAFVVLLALLIPSVSLAEGLCPRPPITETRDFVTPGDKRVEVAWTMGVDERDIPDFGGYRVWVREVWRLETFDLAREYVWGEDDTNAAGYWSLRPFYVDSVRVFVARSVQNAFPYEFSVTAFKASNPDSVNFDCLEENRSGVIYPREGIPTSLSGIQVIPNPYRASADWEYGGNRRVTFVQLPEACTIRIYTVAADLVRTLRHESLDSDQEFWDLKNSDGEEVAPGVYIWALEADGIGSAEGKMLIVK
ncbi:MAG: hypothetical protein ABIG03_04705 [Candidatus Eisenbacteria bacterium]